MFIHVYICDITVHFTGQECNMSIYREPETARKAATGVLKGNCCFDKIGISQKPVQYSQNGPTISEVLEVPGKCKKITMNVDLFSGKTTMDFHVHYFDANPDE